MYYILAFIAIVLLLLSLSFKRLKRKLISVVFPPADIEQVQARQGCISVLTYNVAGLPQGISAAKLPRRLSIAEIGDKINAFDVVNVQEDFNYNPALYALNKHPFRTESKGKIPIGDGLNTLSKLPILGYHRIPWMHCSGADCWTVKGFSVAQLQITSDVIVDVYNVHANSSNKARASKARRENLRQLARYIVEHSAGKPLLVMGDFNAHYAFKKDNLHEFLSQTGLTDGWVACCRDGQFPAVVPNFVASDMLSLHNDVESLDKIFFRSSSQLQFTPAAYQVERALFTDSRGNHLSDHLAVSMQVNWVKIPLSVDRNENQVAVHQSPV